MEYITIIDNINTFSTKKNVLHQLMISHYNDLQYGIELL